MSPSESCFQLNPTMFCQLSRGTAGELGYNGMIKNLDAPMGSRATQDRGKPVGVVMLPHDFFMLPSSDFNRRAKLQSSRLSFQII